MRILYLTEGFPYPLTSGYLRHYHFIRQLSRRHEVTLLSIVSRSFLQEHREGMAAFTKSIFTFPSYVRGGTMSRKIAKRVRSAILGSPAGNRMRVAVRQLLEGDGFDALVLAGKTETFDAVRGLVLPPLLADVCDAGWMRVDAQLPYAPALQRPLLRLRREQLKRIERAIARRAQFVTFASLRDRRAVVGEDAANSVVLPNGVDTDFWCRRVSDRGPDPASIVFTGAMDYAPNVDAALYLIREILPLVRESVPHACLNIVGRNPTNALIRAGAPGVTVTGFVDDVRPYLARASLFVAPLRFGAGIQNKLLEALAMEVPSVVSPLVADGLYTESGDRPPIDVADDTPGFAAAIVRRLSRQSTGGIAPEGRQFVRRHFDWDRIGNRLHELVHATARARRPVVAAWDCAPAGDRPR